MAAFTIPTLILHSQHAVSAPLQLCGRRTAEAIPGGTLKAYEGGSHGNFLSHAVPVNADITEFVGVSDGAMR